MEDREKTAKSHIFRKEERSIPEAGKNVQIEERLRQIDHYISTDYTQPLRLEDLAEKLYLSPGYLARFFKKYYGKNFSEYLTEVRLKHAISDLADTDESVIRIACDNGFTSLAAFNRAMKAVYGVTPTVFRKKNGAEKKNKLVEKEAETRQEKTEAPEKFRISCTATEMGKLQKSWQDTINIGAAADFLQSEIRDHLLELSAMLGFRYVRFRDVFSEELLVDTKEAAGVFNFSKLDMIFDFLLEHHLKPHIELGRKPRRLFRTVGNSLLQEKTVPSEYEKTVYEKLLHTLLQHLLRRYRKKELSTWRMELWMDDSTWEQPGSWELYFEQFELTRSIIKQYAEGIAFGGCCLRNDFMIQEDPQEEYSCMRFLQKWAFRSRQPDFLSITFFGYERDQTQRDGFSRRTEDPSAMLHNLQRMKELVRMAGMDPVPIYVTEWNLTVSDRNYMNDSCFKGAYIIKNMLEICGESECLAYYPGSDRLSEYYDSEGPFYGGSGLISKDSVVKPAGYAFLFLNQMYEWCLEKEEHFLLSTDRMDSYSVICHNQQSLGAAYYQTKENEIDRDSMELYFEDTRRLRLSLELADVKNGWYQIKTWRLNRQYGDPLQNWKQLGYENELTQKDFQYLRHICEPKLTIEKREISGNLLTVELCLEPNEISFMQILKC
ncbi:MAG: helix-turn-helix domain-containing protein [Lachnospiraceae bacterium]|nr:helix-turn-helix domain-containing protein [Lachnospiraceae bacterium]